MGIQVFVGVIFILFSLHPKANARRVFIDKTGEHCSEGIHKDKKYIIKSTGYADNVPIRYSLVKLGPKKFQLGFNIKFSNPKHRKGAEYCTRQYPIRSSDGRQLNLNVSDREAPLIRVGVDNHGHPSMYGWNHSMANIFKASPKQQKKICMVYLHEIMHSTGLVEEYSGRSQALAKVGKRSLQSGQVHPFSRQEILKRAQIFKGQIGRTGCRAVVRNHGLFSGRGTRRAFLYKNQMDVVTNPFCGKSARQFKKCAPLFYAHDQKSASMRRCDDKAAKQCIAEAMNENRECSSVYLAEPPREDYKFKPDNKKKFSFDIKKMTKLTQSLAPLGVQLYQNFKGMRTPANYTPYQNTLSSYPVGQFQRPVLVVRQKSQSSKVQTPLVISPVVQRGSNDNTKTPRVIGR